MRLLAAVFVAVSSMPSSGFAEIRKPFKARAPDLGVTFSSIPGRQADWCDERVVLQAAARRSESLPPRSEAVQQTLGRVRGAVMAECPRAKEIIVRVSVGDRIETTLQLSRVARWAILESDPDDDAAFHCPLVSASKLGCPESVLAFNHAKRLTSQRGLEAVTFTAFLQPIEGRAQLEWASRASIGQLRTIQVSAFGGVAPRATDLVRTARETAGAECTRAGGKSVREVSAQFGENVARQGFSCRRADGDHASEFIAVREGDVFHLHTVVSTLPMDPEAEDLATGFMQAISRAF